MRVSYSQLTEWTGKSYRTLKRLLDGLEPVGTGPTNANLWESQQALEAIYCPQTFRSDDGLDLNAERARESKERADKLELENAVRRKELVETSDLAKKLDSDLVSFKTKLTGLPSKISALLEEPGEQRRIFLEVKAIINETLIDLAQGFGRAME